MMDAKTNDLSTEMSELFRKHAETAGDWCDVVDDDQLKHEMEEKIEDPRPSQPLPPPVPTYNNHNDSRHDRGGSMRRTAPPPRAKAPPASDQETLSIYVWNVPEYATEENLYYFFGGDDDVIDVLRLDRSENPDHPLTGIIKFKCKEAFERAVQMNEKSFMNRRIRVCARRASSNSNNNNYSTSRNSNYGYPGRNSGTRVNQHRQQPMYYHVSNPMDMHVPQGPPSYGHHNHYMPPPMSHSMGRNANQHGYSVQMNSSSYGGQFRRPQQPQGYHQPAQMTHRPAPSIPPVAHAPAPLPPGNPTAPKPNIFGNAKPVDTNAKMLEMFQRQQQSQKKEKPKEKEKDKHKRKPHTPGKRTSENVTTPSSETAPPFTAAKKETTKPNETHSHTKQHNQKKEKEKPKKKQITVLKRSSESAPEEEHVFLDPVSEVLVEPTAVEEPPVEVAEPEPVVEVVPARPPSSRKNSDRKDSLKEAEVEEKKESESPKAASDCDADEEETAPDQECAGDQPSAEGAPATAAKKKKKSKKNRKKNPKPNVLHGNKFGVLDGVSND
ncbi:hypothetical protein QR680_012115 [Steinernema hermaphroditum]|uniref:RRM domain-containing protein n=1 Tax=Steinernema hermaphroditum TaxID=289476 RepID=A0AA39I3G9_9BILA|nr:hypothetical protein QR680_012115 [Steinernema hermaphroditum]